MDKPKRNPTPFKDQAGYVIHEGDICRSWRKHECFSGINEQKGFWLFEQVKSYNDDWYLFEVGFDYSSNDDVPYLLSEHYDELEIISPEKCLKLMA